MPDYVVFAKLTPEGKRRISEHPERLEEIRREVGKLGVKITRQYAVTGEYDFVTFIEAAGNEQVTAAGTELATLGTLRLQTLPSVRTDRFQQLLKLQPYRTEPHRWQTSLWAQAVRRAGRYWTTTRYVRRYAKPFTIEGQEHLRGLRGGAVVIANHSSHFDSPVAFSALPSHLRQRLAIAAAADKFYASRKRNSWWYSLFQNTFPVHRGGGIKQLEYPLSLLRRGWCILIYPEGGRSKSGQIARFKAGPAIMAMQAGVPVIPIYMDGLRNVMPKGQRVPQPAAVHVRVGKPVAIPAGTTVPDATAMLENALRELGGAAPHMRPVPQVAETVGAVAGGS